MIFEILKVILKDEILFYVRNAGEEKGEIFTEWRFYGLKSSGVTENKIKESFKNSIVKSNWKHTNTFIDNLNINFSDY